MKNATLEPGTLQADDDFAAPPRQHSIPERVGAKVTANPETGTAMLHAINRAMAKHGHSLDEAAAIIGMSPVTLRALGGGRRLFCDVDRRILASAAKYIGVPVAQAHLMAGALKPEDFFFENSLNEEIELAYRSMMDHPMWCGYAPDRDAFLAMPQKTQVFIVMLYESATQQKFLTGTGVQLPQ